MNAIRATRQLNQRELDNAVPPSASWHVDYRDTAYVYIGGLPLDLSEGDVVTIFSQFGNPTHLNLVRDRETGKSRGFAFLKYEDQRSCDLAVDNLGGAEVLGRMLRVDHSRYKKKDGEDEDTWRIDRLEIEGADGTKPSDTEDEHGDESEEERRRRKKRKTLKAGRETLAIEPVMDDDPMKEYILREKKDELERATAKDRERRHKHHHRHSHRERENEDEEVRHKSRRHRDRNAELDGNHRARRHRDADRDDDIEMDTRSHSRRHRDDEHKDESRRDTERGHRKPKRVDDETSRLERSRSPDGRDRRRRDGGRDRDVDIDKGSRRARSSSVDRDRDRGRRRRGSDE